ncbi:acetoacetate--CoA ligase [Picrophilus oshimae]|uniref:Acetoacetyl-CoA synthetase n=1 Tax=Picrophilus torridus (strain ATCC 700027 / DSM 9790 / JCM 10055 / NBRC 100828 / KAW 2/3) TaxID=1122961 RepID=A0A8G2FXN1_PICTO|nr:acetoacetate--CoA ligase [Picrophilus oshimae]SMD31387.1 acetoacetyl-CoA synthetase [Picrophilus oshimae DSM 9789]
MGILFKPDINNSDMEKFINNNNYHDAFKNSIKDLNGFWKSLASFYGIELNGSYKRGENFIDSSWFNETRINYTDLVLKNKNLNGYSIIYINEKLNEKRISWNELSVMVYNLAGFLIEIGLKKGDVVAGYINNNHYAIISFLAASLIGCTWTCVSQDFGLGAVISRFQQSNPKVLIASPFYYYNGVFYDKTNEIKRIIVSVKSIKNVIVTDKCDIDSFIFDNIRSSKNVNSNTFFNDPLWILYSSGTTGIPKAMVQSQGGIILEHIKSLGLHLNISKNSRFMWLTNTSWMMWNFMVSGLLLGSTLVIYDGNPYYPGNDDFWKAINKNKVTHFGAGAPYFSGLMKSGYDFKFYGDYIGSTGSPMPPEVFDYIYKNNDVWLSPISGGTDICTAFITANPLLPVIRGRMQCIALGADVSSYDENGLETRDVGELVIRQPMPSMPIYFLNDPGNKRYIDAYFSYFKNVWRHGDWVKIFDDGSVIIYGRSDSTLNKKGIRIGTGDYYSILNKIDHVIDSLIVGIELENGDYYMPLFVKLDTGINDDIIKNIKNEIVKDLGKRYVPDEVIQVPDIPETLSGKKMEVPVKRILSGYDIKNAYNKDSMVNPESMQFFIKFRERVMKMKPMKLK